MCPFIWCPDRKQEGRTVEEHPTDRCYGRTQRRCPREEHPTSDPVVVLLHSFGYHGPSPSCMFPPFPTGWLKIAALPVNTTFKISPFSRSTANHLQIIPIKFGDGFRSSFALHRHRRGGCGPLAVAVGVPFGYLLLHAAGQPTAAAVRLPPAPGAAGVAALGWAAGGELLGVLYADRGRPVGSPDLFSGKRIAGLRFS